MSDLMKITIVSVVLMIVITIVSVLYYLSRHPCLESHTEMVHRPAWAQWVMVGKVVVPIFHPATDKLEEVCDLRK